MLLDGISKTVPAEVISTTEVFALTTSSMVTPNSLLDQKCQRSWKLWLQWEPWSQQSYKSSWLCFSGNMWQLLNKGFCCSSTHFEQIISFHSCSPRNSGRDDDEVHPYRGHGTGVFVADISGDTRSIHNTLQMEKHRRAGCRLFSFRMLVYEDFFFGLFIFIKFQVKRNKVNNIKEKRSQWLPMDPKVLTY